MAVIDINFHPSRKELKTFALLQIVFFAIVAAIVYQKIGSVAAATTITGVALAVGIVGFFQPAWIRWIYVGWMTAVFPIGFVISHVVMAFVFYVVLTPIGLLMRLCGRDPMQRRFDRSATTYWQPRPKEMDPRRYFRQF